MSLKPCFKRGLRLFLHYGVIMRILRTEGV
nr:MAG TPA: hypothetical protein [Caudoviricetes sp.]